MKPTANLLTAKQLKEEVHYEPSTGVFTRLRKTTRSEKGDVAGSLSGSYLRFRVRGVEYLSHRLAWLYMTGEFPAHLIDHRDRNPLNNCFDNLREATSFENNQNTLKPRGNRSGFIGVSLHKQSGLWRARINLGSKCCMCTYHKTPEQARDAYLTSKQIIHPFAHIV